MGDLDRKLMQAAEDRWIEPEDREPCPGGFLEPACDRCGYWNEEQNGCGYPVMEE